MNEKRLSKDEPAIHPKISFGVPSKDFGELVLDIIDSSQDGWYIDYRSFDFVIIALPRTKGGNRIVLDYLGKERGFSVNADEEMDEKTFGEKLREQMAYAIYNPLLDIKPKLPKYEQMKLF